MPEPPTTHTDRLPDSEDPLAAAARGVIRGDAKAIESFVLTVGPQVLRASRRILGVSHPDVEDVAQEAMYAVIQSLPNFRWHCTVMHFVWRVAALTALNARRRVRLNDRITRAALDPEDAPSGAPSPMGDALATRQREGLRQLLDQLPPEQSEALAMHCVLGCTVEESAAAMGVPINTLRGRLVTAKTALRRILAENTELSELLRGA